MRGNLHVRFLGEAAAATLPPYPISGLLQVYRSPLPSSAMGRSKPVEARFRNS